MHFLDRVFFCGCLLCIYGEKEELGGTLVSPRELLIAIKAKPFLGRTTISSGDKRLRGRGGGFAGGGSKARGVVVGNEEGGFATNRLRKAQ